MRILVISWSCEHSFYYCPKYMMTLKAGKSIQVQNKKLNLFWNQSIPALYNIQCTLATIGKDSVDKLPLGLCLLAIWSQDCAECAVNFGFCHIFTLAENPLSWKKYVEWTLLHLTSGWVACTFPNINFAPSCRYNVWHTKWKCYLM